MCCCDATLHPLRTPDMVDVVNLRRYKCHTEDCQRQAYYNFLGLSRSKAKFCSTHKLPDMLNVRHRLCENDGCRTTPTYSFAGDRPRCDLSITRDSIQPEVFGALVVLTGCIRPDERPAWHNATPCIVAFSCAVVSNVPEEYVYTAAG